MSERKSRYILRHAADMYWLLDIKQPGVPYRKPIPMNEMGATIWQMLCDGYDVDRIAQALHEEYEADTEEIREDVLLFLQSLEQQGI